MPAIQPSIIVTDRSDAKACKLPDSDVFAQEAFEPGAARFNMLLRACAAAPAYLEAAELTSSPP
jgi:hypothetical protein